MPWLRLRKITLEPAAAQAAASYKAQFKRFEECWTGLQWLLARNPNPVDANKTTISGTEYTLYGVEGDRHADLPEIWAAYTYDDHEVLIRDVYATEAPRDEEES